MHTKPQNTHAENPATEGSDINVKGVLGFAAGLTVCTLLVAWAMYGMFGVLRDYFMPKPVTPNPLIGVREPVPVDNITPKTVDGIFPQPRLQTDYYEDKAEREAKWNKHLHEYGWVDKNAGVVHIPIEVAMELTAQRGLPVRGPNGEMPPPPPAPKAAPATGTAPAAKPATAGAKPAAQ